MILAQNPACNPSCGACHYKALDYDDQLARKQHWAELNLGEWGHALQPIIPAPESERLSYRSKTWLRSSFENGALSFGMHRAVKIDGKWKREHVSWDTCPIHVQAIQKMISRLREVLVLKARDFSCRSLFGVWMGSPHLVIVGKEPHCESLEKIDWNEVLIPPFDRVWFHRTNQVGRTVFQHEEFHLLAGLPADDEHPIRAFRQVAQTLLSMAQREACSSLLASKPSLVVDLYCGTGELSRLLPPSVAWLGIEASQSAATYAGNRRSSGEILHQAFTGTVEQRLRDPGVLKKISGRYSLYINPPRSGLSREARDRVLAMIRQRPPTSLVFLSCSASSLARDLKPFEMMGYRVDRLQPFDFFPQTEHFETLAVLTEGTSFVAHPTPLKTKIHSVHLNESLSPGEPRVRGDTFRLPSRTCDT